MVMKVFLNGIAGTGMSSLAGLFKQKGYEVSGSDVNFYPPVDQILKEMNIKLYRPYSQENIPVDIDFCVIGNIISRGNPEAEYILNNHITYYSMAEALYKFFIKGKKSIVVAGTHGKTTITCFVSHMLHLAGENPGYFIGGKPLNFQTNYSTSEGDYFVTEGDEYETSFFDRSSKFLKYHPQYLILSALEYDHLDFFSHEHLYIKSFQNLVNQVPSQGIIILNNDYPMNHKVVEKAFTPVITYGESVSDYRIENINFRNDFYLFSLKHGRQTRKFKTNLWGRYNIWNLCAGIILGFHLGISEKVIKEAVETFAGVERRLNEIKRIKNTIFIEDFAHHPTSIKQVLSSLKEAYPHKKIITFFEPRSWSLRRNYFQDQLCDCFLDADQIFFKEVYQKERIPQSECLDVTRIKGELSSKGKQVTIFNDVQEIKDFLKGIDFSEERVIVILSNGDFGGIPNYIKNL
jgi:UDP-N-acetylmuramate: L-alanyl-gamma-D-glutamyl-meso-diaminopimelate ligase